MSQHTESNNTIQHSFPGQYLKERRIEMGLSQRQAAFKAGISPSTLSRLESGQRLQPRSYVELSEVYKIDPKDLRFKKSIKTISERVDRLKSLFPDWKDLFREMI